MNSVRLPTRLQLDIVLQFEHGLFTQGKSTSRRRRLFRKLDGAVCSNIGNLLVLNRLLDRLKTRDRHVPCSYRVDSIVLPSKCSLLPSRDEPSINTCISNAMERGHSSMSHPRNRLGGIFVTSFLSLGVNSSMVAKHTCIGYR
jgi:hypothetical protein